MCPTWNRWATCKIYGRSMRKTAWTSYRINRQRGWKLRNEYPRQPFGTMLGESCTLTSHASVAARSFSLTVRKRSMLSHRQVLDFGFSTSVSWHSLVQVVRIVRTISPWSRHLLLHGMSSLHERTTKELLFTGPLSVRGATVLHALRFMNWPIRSWQEKTSGVSGSFHNDFLSQLSRSIQQFVFTRTAFSILVEAWHRAC